MVLPVAAGFIHVTRGQSAGLSWAFLHIWEVGWLNLVSDGLSWDRWTAFHMVCPLAIEEPITFVVLRGKQNHAMRVLMPRFRTDMPCLVLRVISQSKVQDQARGKG